MTDNVDTQDLLYRLLDLLTPEQLALFTDDVEFVAKFSHGYITIKRIDGKWFTVEKSGSDRMPPGY